MVDTMKTLKYYLFLLFFSTGFFSSAQSLQFHNLTMADGLSHSVIQTIGQDKYGFIWIGTESGLNVYNGIRFKHFYPVPSGETTISGNSIAKLVFDGDPVWVGTRIGLCKMDIQTKK